MKNTYLVTGATGFIGANITRALVKKGEKVNIIVRNRKLNWRLTDIASKIHIYETDILSPSLSFILDNIRPDYIFHMAAYGVLPSENDTHKMVDVNIKGTINLIEAIKKNPFRLFINTGTSVEYGIKDGKMKESDILVPINDYGITKAATTLYCQKEAIRNKLPIITFRLFTPFGFYEDKNRLVPSAILSALRNQAINVSVPGSVRDFIFIDDVVSAYFQATQKKIVPGLTLNIGSGKKHTIGSIVNSIKKITKSHSKVVWGAVKSQERFIEPKKWEADISLSRKLLQWEPKYSLGQGLEETIEWFSQNQKLYA